VPSGVPLYLDGKKYFTGIGIDITEQKKLQNDLSESQAILKAAFENSLAGIAIADAPDGRIRYVNKAGLKIRNKSEEELVNNIDFNSYVESWGIYHLDGTPYLKEEVPLTRAMLNGETLSEELLIRRDDQEDRYVLANAAPIRDSNDEIIAGILVFLDITDRKMTMRTLIESERKYSSYVENSPEGIFVIDKNGRYIDVNRAVLEFTGYSKEELLNMNIGDITAAESYKDALGLFRELLKTGKTKGEIRYSHKNGETRWCSIDAVYLSNNHYLGFTIDITERKKVESELFYLSYHDHLTELYNRRYFEQELKRLDNSRNLPFSIIMCDVNGLKLVNDSFGHEAGDTLLKKAAKTIKMACRAYDLVARIGGDEFVVLLPKTTLEETTKIANQIKELAQIESVANIKLSISCGYDTKTIESKSIVEVIANAENHMYRHKLYERSSIRSKTIDLVMNTLFEKSTREAEHSRRVSSLCQAIATKMNFSKDGINQMKIAGLIHDIGKIGVDEKILNKPGSLTIDERRDVERHPEIGWRLLSSTNEFSELAQFVLSHHEKWDGSGYPNGLKGEEINLEARIISVADAYDALTSERPYRKGLSDEEATKEIKRCSGTQFDPEIVSVLINQVLADNIIK
jgi:diguanylate cyclase (GGDEF)-like protein/PAS domain S-box-containing protein